MSQSRLDLITRLSGARIPLHLAVVPDGNRRWALSRGSNPVDGHRKGFEISKRLSRFCRDIGIHTVTVWAFSTENWRRAAAETSTLLSLFEDWLYDLLPEVIEEEIRVIHVGRKEGVPLSVREDAEAAGFPEGLPISLREALMELEQKTASFERNIINLAINYGGADEIQRAIEKMIAIAGSSGQDASLLQIEDFLDTAGQPYPSPDLVWRTSGEFRSSGFLPLQSAYAEMIFTPKYFPELSEEDVVEAVLEYSGRMRRFGG
jgi:undecaprenyl diphosphate synthase